MIYSSDMCVDITRVQIGVCWESDVVSPMQNWIHPHSPVAAAADIVFHIRPACWQRAWHPRSSCFLLLFSPPLPFFLCFSPLSLTCPLTQTHFSSSLSLPLISLSGAVISPVCPAWQKKKKVQNKPKTVPVWWHHFCHSYSANMFETTSGSNFCECESVCVLTFSSY